MTWRTKGFSFLWYRFFSIMRYDRMVSRQGIHSVQPYGPWTRRVGTVVVLGVLTGLAGVAMTVPFVFETQSLWYKFGTDKVMLRSGKIVGLMAALCLLCQILLVVRLSLLDKLFGQDRLYVSHKLNGCLILVLVLVHATLVLLPEGFTNLPIGKKYWPEMVGFGLWLAIAGTTCVAVFRSRLDIRYSIWRVVHRFIGYLIPVVLTVHVLWVSEAFNGKPLSYVASCMVGMVLLVSIGKKGMVFWLNRERCEVSAVHQLTDSVTRISVRLPPRRSFGYMPGQFAYLSFESGRYSEPHPFTIASSPTDRRELQFMIKNCGDWTAGVADIRVGEGGRVNGPYGLFTHLKHSDNREIIMVAGGIGITPMLSMLRYMADEDRERLVTLIWCNRSPDQMFLGEEIEDLHEKMPGLDAHLVYTRAKHGSRRMDMDRLNSLTKGCDRKALMFICGPYPLMVRVSEDAVALGFARENIYYERFSL